MPESVIGLSGLLAFAYLALTTVPGLIVGAAAGIRGWLLVAVAPLLGYGLVGGAGSILPLFDIRWSPVSLLVITAITSVVFLGARLVTQRYRSTAVESAAGGVIPWTLTQHLGVAATSAFAAAVGFVATATATRDFTAIPQIWDSVFHANATNFIVTTGESAPSALRELNQPDVESYYYPNGYHVVAATFIMLTKVAVPATLELSFAVVPAYLAVGFAALIRNMGGRPALAACAAVLSCAFTAFPYDLLPWGTLLPFLTVVALLPAFIALWARLLQGRARQFSSSIVLGFAGVGIIALHPSVAVAALLLGIGILVQTWVRRGPLLLDAKVIGATAVSAAILGAPLILASATVAGGPAYDWPTSLLPADALGQVVLQSHGQSYPQWWLALLTFVGLASLQRNRSLIWLAVVGLFFAGLFMLAASYEGYVVELLTKPWWNDKWRLAALWTLCAIPLAAAGMVIVKDFLWSAIQRTTASLTDQSRRRSQLASGALLIAVIALVVQATETFYLTRNSERLSQAFADGPTVSETELRAFERLAQIVPDGSLVMNDPYDGSAWMWALVGVRPAFASPVIAGSELPIMEKNRRILFDSFNRIDNSAAVREAVRELDIKYVILCKGFIAPAGDHVPGMQDLRSVDALEPVFENADAVIFRIRDASEAALEGYTRP